MTTNNTNWQLEASRFNSPHLRTFFASIAADQLILSVESGVGLATTERRIQLFTEGQEWSLPSVNGTLTNIRLTLLEREHELAMIYSLEQLEATLNFSDYGISIPVIGKEMNHGELLLATNPRQQFPSRFVKSFVSENLAHILLDHTNDYWDANYLLILRAENNRLLAFHQLEVDLRPLSLPLLSDHIVSCSLNLLKRPNQGGIPALSWIGRGVIRLDQEYIMELTSTLQGGIQVVIHASESGFPGPVVISQLLGLDTLSKTLDSAIERLPFADTFKLQTVSFAFHPHQKTIFSGRLHGSMTIKEHDLFFSLALPHFHLSATLNPETPILLSEIIGDYTPNGSGLSKDLRISRLEAAMSFQPNALNLQIEIDSIWKIHIGKTPISFDQLYMGIRVQSEKEPQLHIRANWHLGKTDIALSAQNTSGSENKGWLFSTEIAHETKISIRDLALELANLFQFSVPETFPDITLNNIDLSFHTGTQAFHLHAEAHLETAFGPMQKGDLELTLKLNKDSKSGKHTFELNLHGTITIQQTELHFRTEITSNGWNIQLDWMQAAGEGLHLTHLISAIAPDFDPNSIPTQIEKALTLSHISVGYDSSNKTFSGQLITEGKQELFILGRSGKNGGLIAGLAYHRPDEIPHFGEHLKGIQRDVELVDLWLVLNTFDKGAQLPERPSIANSNTPAWPIEVSKMGKGLAITANLAIKTKAQGAFGNLKNALPKGSDLTISGQIDFSKKELRLGVDSKHKFTFPTKDGKDFIIQNCGIELVLSTTAPSISVYGDIEFFLDQYKIQAGIDFKLDTKGVELSGFAKVPGGVPLFGLKNVSLHSVGIGIGIKFSPPAATFALQGEMTFRENQKLKDYFGAKLAFSSAIPVPLYVAMDISEISFTEIIQNLQFKAVNKGKFVPAKMVKIEALSFQYAAEKTTLPDRTKVEPGVSFHGLFTINDFKAWIEFQASEKGVNGLGQFSKIETQGIKVSGDSKDLKRLSYLDEGEWHPVSNAGRLLPDVVTQDHTILNGGGPVLSFSTIKSPYLRADFHIKILNISETKLDIEVSDKGLKCKLFSEFKGLYHVDMDVAINPPTEVHSIGSFSAGPKVELPFLKDLQPIIIIPHEVGLNISGSQNIRTGTKESFYLDFRCKYTLLSFTSPEFKVHFDHSPKDFGDFLKMALKTFYDNVPALLIEFLVPKFIPINTGGRPAKPNKAGGGQVIKRRTSLATSASIGWLNDAIELTQAQGQKRMRALDSTTKLEKLIERAKTENREEIERMHAVKHGLDVMHEDVISDGKKRMKSEIKRLKREISDLEDPNHTLENAIIELWNKHLITYKDACYECFEAESELALYGTGKQRLKHARKAVEKVENTVQAGLAKITVEYDPEKGYSSRKNAWVAAAVDHHSAVVKLKVDTGIERSYLMQKKMEAHDLTSLALRSSKQPIIIQTHLKQIDHEGAK